VKLQALMPLVTYPDPNSESSIVNGIEAATLVDAAIHFLALEADIPPVANPLARVLINLPEMIETAERMSAGHGTRLREFAEASAAAAGRTLTTDAVKGHLPLLGNVAAEQARYFDLSLVGWSAANPGARLVAETVLFGSGRPLLLLPEARPVSTLGRIVVAWDGGRVAARAVADARMFIERASKVTVVTVVDEKPLQQSDPARKLSARMRQAGIAAEDAAIRAAGTPIAEVLQRHAIEAGADLLVMGAFGHSRLREFVLGGATQGILSDLRLPTLLTH
jgi:nucleotide-binding universal stress UspA family protein